MSKYTIALFIAPFLFAACGQPDPQEIAASESSAIPAAQDARPGLELAHPQPTKPACANCSAVVPTEPKANDDELSMILNSEYVGYVDDLIFIEYTDNDMITHTFDQSVIDDLNDSGTTETIVMMEIPDILRGLLIFEIDGSDFYDPISITYTY